MTLRINVKFKATCAKHRKYDPEKLGEAGIRGGCVDCFALLAIWKNSRSYLRSLDEAKLARGLK